MTVHRYELGVTKTTTASAQGICTIIPATLAAGVQPPWLLEMGIFNVSGVAAEIGLGIPGNTPAATSPVAVAPLTGWENTGDTTVGTAWGTAPTAPSAANTFRRAELPAVVGAALIWTWDEAEFTLWSGATAGGQLVLWQFSALAVTYDVYIQVHE